MLTDEEPLFPEAEIKFATFWPRLGALLLDTVIIGATTIPLTYLNLSSWKIPGIFILTTLISISYKPIMEYK